jgi:hypothetical protein
MARQDAPYLLRDALTGFESRGIALPDEVNAAVAHWEAIKARTPTDQAPTALRDAIAGGADDNTLDRLLVRDLGSTRLKSAYTQAAISAASAALAAILDHRADIHRQLSKLADDAIKKLETIAALGDTTLDSLVRSGRTADARVFADRQVIGAELHALYGLRDAYLLPGGVKAARVGHVDCTQWRDISAVDGHLYGDTVVDRYLGGLRAGGGALWFPSGEEAVAAAQPIHDQWQREAEAAAAERRAQGGIAAFGGW